MCSLLERYQRVAQADLPHCLPLTPSWSHAGVRSGLVDERVAEAMPDLIEECLEKIATADVDAALSRIGLVDDHVLRLLRALLRLVQEKLDFRDLSIQPPRNLSVRGRPLLTKVRQHPPQDDQLIPCL